MWVSILMGIGIMLIGVNLESYDDATIMFLAGLVSLYVGVRYYYKLKYIAYLKDMYSKEESS